MTRPTTDKRRTRIAILIGVVGYTLYDLWTYFRYGGHSSISTAVGEWMTAAYYGWAVCAILGGLTGHFVGMMVPAETSCYHGRLAVVGVAIAVGYLLTLSS